MISYNKLDYLRGLCDNSKYSKRIICQLNYACNLSNVLDGKFDEIINGAIEYLYDAVKDEGGVITKACAMTAENMLLSLKDTAKSIKIHCVSHAHIDMNWMWGYNETVAVTIDTFRTILNLMDEYPEFTFAQSQASTYEIVEKFAPYMLDDIKRRIKEGRWEVSASTWVETDKNMPTGEALARHILYTKRYLSKLLDIKAESLDLEFEPDTFGHNISVPEICAAGGVKYYYHCRGNVRKENIYRWKGRGGSELIVYRDPHWYNFPIEEDMFSDAPILCKQHGIPELLTAYGVGDHGGGPTRRDVNRIIEMSGWPIMPDITFSTYGRFFSCLEKYRENIPVVEGELNYIFNGCYTSQSKIKLADSIGQARIYESEVLSCQSNMVGGYDFKESFKEAWKNILFNQFHDILPGSGVADTREHAMGRFQDAMAYIATNANTAMDNIASQINTSVYSPEREDDSVSEGGGVGFGVSSSGFYKMPYTERALGKKRIYHLFNPNAYDFNGVAEIIVYDYNYENTHVVFTDSSGNRIEHQLLEGGKGYWDHAYNRYALKVKVPAFGYATYIIDSIDNNAADSFNLQYMRADAYMNDSWVLENRYIRAEFDSITAELVKLIDKKSNCELISSPSGTFRSITENPSRGMTSWRVGDYLKIDNINHNSIVKITGISGGALRKSFGYSTNFGERSKLNVKVYLDDNSPMLNYEITVDYHETGNREKGINQLNFALPFNYEADSCRYDVAYGTIERGKLNYDVPAVSFAMPINKNGSSLVMMSDCKHGFRFTDNILALALVRASYDPDPYPEYGVHKMRIGIGVCSNTSNDNELYRISDEFIHPISCCAANLKKNGSLDFDGQFLSVDGDVRVSALKTAEDGNGYIVRFFNVKNSDSEWSIKLFKNVSSAYYADINENKGGKVSFDGNKLSGVSSPYAITTILFELE